MACVTEKSRTKLSLDEKRTQALVPEKEWPYKVPENWCWVYAPSVYEIEYGKGLSTKQLTESGYPVFGANGQIGWYSSYMFKKPQPLMSCRGAYSGTMNISLPFSFITSNSLVIHSKWREESPKYTKYLFESQDTKSLVTGTAQPQVTVQAFTNYPVPIIPLAEQQRIVDLIESLFEKLDAAREKAEEVVDGYEDRKSAIMKSAFSGDLTKKWRLLNSRSNSMRWELLSDVCSKITDGTHHSPPNSEDGDYMYVTAKNIKENEIDLTNITYVSKAVHEEIYSRCDAQYRDVLYIKDGATTGIAAVNSIQEPFSLLSSVALLRPRKDLLRSEYLSYALNSRDIKAKMLNKMAGVAITRLTLKKIKSSEIPVFDLEEQDAIITILNDLLNKEKRVKDTAERVIDQIDNLKTTILARAFRGELGTNDPSDESAVELLKQILQES